MTSALIALGLLVSPAQDKITLKFNPKAGDRMTAVETSSMKVDMKVTAGGQVQQVATEQKGSKKEHREVLSVEGGRITGATFHLEEDVESRKAPGQAEFVSREKPLHGRKITVKREGEKLVYTGADGVEDAARESLKLEDSFARTYPKEPVAVGDSWDATKDVMQEIFNDPNLDGTAKFTLTKVGDHEGRRCAFIDADLSIKGNVENGPTMTMKLKGKVIVWIDRGYTLRATLEGPVSMSMKNERMELDGGGPMKFEMTASVK